jgi:hypothetical protein
MYLDWKGRIAALRRMRDELARVVGCACSSLHHCTCGAAYLTRQGKEPALRPPLLHVTNGESAGNTLRQTAIGGAVLAWQDALHEGPVPARPRQELLRTRARFLADCGWGRQQALLSSLDGHRGGGGGTSHPVVGHPDGLAHSRKPARVPTSAGRTIVRRTKSQTNGGT